MDVKYIYKTRKADAMAWPADFTNTWAVPKW